MVKLSARFILIAATLLAAAGAAASVFGDSAQVVFDLPYTVECRDVTPTEFAAAHPSLKVVEAKFHISARVVAGSESNIEDFLYIVASPDKKIRFQDYLPNTSLENSVADDQIEITDSTENAKGGEIGAKVAYQGIGGGLSRTKSSKTTHSSHYKEIAPRSLVVASGTTDHEHGIFFKLRPSRAASLEGAKAFTFLAIVPKSWRGGWCTISCAARAKSKTLFSRIELVPAGVAQSQMGLHLMGDAEANKLAEDLGTVQQRHADVLAGQLAMGGLLETMHEAASTGQTAPMCGVFKKTVGGRFDESGQLELEKARNEVLTAQKRLQRLSE